VASTSSSAELGPKYAISYGLTGGPGHSKRMRKLLSKNGYRETRNLSEADLIIAHSAGCWLPVEISPKLVFLIGPPLADPTFKTWLKAYRQNLKDFVSSQTDARRGSRVIAFNLIYAVTQPRKNGRIIRKAKNSKLQPFKDSRIVFLANHFDPWPNPSDLKEYTEGRDWAFLSLSGAHDNIWANPDKYVPIINHYAKQLLA
jgi:hypothetical protein